MSPPADACSYRGRFAPSPTGPLHFGSLVTALASYLDAKSAGGHWLVRLEDLDRNREVPGFADDILRTLEGFGFAWDGEILRQSARTRAYDETIEALRRLGLVYPCACSRREIAERAVIGAEGPIYPGTCRQGLPAGRQARSLRVRIRAGPSVLRDRIQGRMVQDLAQEVGDFVLRRADGFYAYQLAVVVDDAFQGVNQVVRGADLLLSTPRQVFLLRNLGAPVPAYAHVPLAVDGTGRKLSKSHAAAPVDPANPLPSLLQAWGFLGQSWLVERPANLNEFWQQALASWWLGRVPARRAIAVQPA